jgi:DNA primase
MGRLVRAYGKSVDGIGTPKSIRKAVVPEPTVIDINSFPRISDDNGDDSLSARKYLYSRSFGDEEIAAYDIRYARDGRFHGRVIFPIYEFGKFVCLSARAYIKGLEPRYLFPHSGETFYTASESIFGYSDIGLDRSVKIVLVEGVIDAISARRKLPEDYRSVALLSKHLSDFQLQRLMALGMGRKYYIMLDSDAKEEATDVARKLERCQLANDKRDVRICSIKAKDPDEATESDISEAIINAKPYVSGDICVEF